MKILEVFCKGIEQIQRSENAQPQNKVLRSWGLGGLPSTSKH
jgi:hypothetical protein